MFLLPRNKSAKISTSINSVLILIKVTPNWSGATLIEGLFNASECYSITLYPMILPFLTMWEVIALTLYHVHHHKCFGKG